MITSNPLGNRAYICMMYKSIRANYTKFTHHTSVFFCCANKNITDFDEVGQIFPNTLNVAEVEKIRAKTLPQDVPPTQSRTRTMCPMRMLFHPIVCAVP